MRDFPPLNREFACDCGKPHRIAVGQVSVNEEAATDLREFLLRRGFSSVLVIDDATTGEVLGERVLAVLASAGLSVFSLRFAAVNGGHLRADRSAIDKAVAAIAEHGVAVVVSVGSGTLTDIARYASFLQDRPFVAMATAPSVDGYASTVAALQFDGVKVTRPAQAPLAVFALPSVLSSAPWSMIQSGFGDLVGKMTALMDWKLARLLYDEPWCERTYRLVADAVNRVLEGVAELNERHPQAVEDLFWGLVMSGMAMAMAGNSRPASGSEHHLSHYWDFLTYQGKRPYVAHGLQVGYATYVMLSVYDELQEVGELALPRPEDDHDDAVRQRWGAGADDILREQRTKAAWLNQHYQPEKWSGMRGDQLIVALDPEYQQRDRVKAAIRAMGMGPSGETVSVTPAMLADGLRHAREVRARYTIFDWLSGQDRLEALIGRLVPCP